MSSKLLIIIATGDKEKALTGLMYARNALKRRWLEDVKIVFFGPSALGVVSNVYDSKTFLRFFTQSFVESD